MNANLKARVLSVLLEVAPDIDPERLQSHVAFHDQFDFDSLDMLNFALALRRTFGIDVSRAACQRLASMDGTLAFVSARLDAK